MSEPPEIQWFETKKDKKWIFFIVFRILDGSLWICNPQGGFGPYISAVASYWGFIQPANKEEGQSETNMHLKQLWTQKHFWSIYKYLYVDYRYVFFPLLKSSAITYWEQNLYFLYWKGSKWKLWDKIK